MPREQPLIGQIRAFDLTQAIERAPGKLQRLAIHALHDCPISVQRQRRLQAGRAFEDGERVRELLCPLTELESDI